METPAHLIKRNSRCAYFVRCFVVCNLILVAAQNGPIAAAQAHNAATSNAGWVKFQDPFEKAFTVEVPQDWAVKGGLFRLGYSDFRPMVDLKSPDGKTYIRFGDVAIPTYSLPDQSTVRDGEPYDLGAQGQMVVAKYRLGQDYAREYSRFRFEGVCQSVTRQATDAPAPVAEKDDQDKDIIQTSAGQVSYRCDTREGVRTAYVYARTALHHGFWQVTSIASFITPPEQVSAVRNIILRSSESAQLNPQWIQYQREMDREGLDYQRLRQQTRRAEFNQQIQQYESKMQTSRNQVNAFARQQNAHAAQVQGFDDVLVGVTPTIDPLTGENRRVWTGTKSSYWSNGREIRNSDTSPGPGWHQLEQPPPR